MKLMLGNEIKINLSSSDLKKIKVVASLCLSLLIWGWLVYSLNWPHIAIIFKKITGYVFCGDKESIDICFPYRNKKIQLTRRSEITDSTTFQSVGEIVFIDKHSQDIKIGIRLYADSKQRIGRNPKINIETEPVSLKHIWYSLPKERRSQIITILQQKITKILSSTLSKMKATDPGFKIWCDDFFNTLAQVCKEKSENFQLYKELGKNFIKLLQEDNDLARCIDEQYRPTLDLFIKNMCACIDNKKYFLVGLPDEFKTKYLTITLLSNLDKCWQAAVDKKTLRKDDFVYLDLGKEDRSSINIKLSNKEDQLYRKKPWDKIIEYFINDQSLQKILQKNILQTLQTDSIKNKLIALVVEIASDAKVWQSLFNLPLTLQTSTDLNQEDALLDCLRELIFNKIEGTKSSLRPVVVLFIRQNQHAFLKSLNQERQCWLTISPENSMEK